jgi:hypothetical protein
MVLVPYGRIEYQDIYRQNSHFRFLTFRQGLNLDKIIFSPILRYIMIGRFDLYRLEMLSGR